MYLQPQERPRAFAELARVLKPGGLVAAAFKVGDNSHRRAGAQLDLGIEFDIYWLSHDEFRRHFSDSGFRIVFSAERPAGPEEGQPQGYLIAERL